MSVGRRSFRKFGLAILGTGVLYDDFHMFEHVDCWKDELMIDVRFFVKFDRNRYKGVSVGHGVWRSVSVLDC